MGTVVAYADTAAKHVATGEDLAKRGHLTEAIASFKAADSVEPRAKHACLIALAYLRRELLPQAEVFLSLCNDRATDTDPRPDWLPLARKQLDERLAKARVAPVVIRVVPSELRARVAVSSWEPDETFAPQTIHLPRGTHLITATVEGRPPAQHKLEIVDDHEREVVLDFAQRSVAPMPPPQPASPPSPTRKATASRVPTYVLGAGGALAVTAIAYHVFAFKPARDDLAAAANGPGYDALEGRFDARRTTSIALYGGAAAALTTGIILRYALRNREGRPLVSLAVSQDGAVARVEWRR